MKNITRLSIWPALKELGFIPIRFRAHGKVVAIGAALQQEHIDINDKPFKSDIICIEPKCQSFTDKRNYHITGQIKTPYWDTVRHQNAIGRMVTIPYERKSMNEFFTARDILKTVQLMLK